MTASRRAGRLSGVGCGRRHRDVAAGGSVQGALVDAGYVADESDGLAGVLVVAAAVAVAFQ